MYYDYLVVGAGLFGAIFAREAADRGKSVLVIDKRDHIAGNIYTKEVEGINVHEYGAHIFHTNNKLVWNYINRFAEFNRYTNSPVANYNGEIYSLPFNMYTFNKMWNVVTPDEAREKIASQVEEAGITDPKNLEEQAISLVGTDIYEKLIKGYTEKQWGRDCKDLPSFIIKRLPVRYTYDNNYGLNLEVTVSCDITDFIIEQRMMFQDVIAKQVAVDMLREFAYNSNVRTNRHSINASRLDILYEVDGDSSSMKKSGLSYQLDMAFKAIKLSTSGIDRVCLPCRNNGVKYRTV